LLGRASGSSKSVQAQQVAFNPIIGFYPASSSPQPFIRKTSKVKDSVDTHTDSPLKPLNLSELITAAISPFIRKTPKPKDAVHTPSHAGSPLKPLNLLNSMIPCHEELSQSPGDRALHADYDRQPLLARRGGPLNLTLDVPENEVNTKKQKCLRLFTKDPATAHASSFNAREGELHSACRLFSRSDSDGKLFRKPIDLDQLLENSRNKYQNRDKTTQLRRKAQIRGREDPHQVIKQAKEIVAQLHIKADLRIQCFLQFLYLCNLLYYAILAFAILSRALVLALVHLLGALCSSTPWGARTCRTPKAESRGTLPKLYTPSRFGVSNGAWLSLEPIQDCWS
jgi:hypothetical protein